MARYTYTGPVQNISLAVGRKKDKDGVERSEFKDFRLSPNGKPVDLPEGNPIIASMLDSKLLIPVEAKETGSKAPATSKGDK